MPSVTIKELHRITGAVVRKAGASRVPLIVTDRGEPVAVISRPSILKRPRRKRTLLPEFRKLMAKAPGRDMINDLNAVRGDR